MVDQGTADIAVAQSQRLGYLDGKALAGSSPGCARTTSSGTTG
jgi:hypothetical protein